MSITRIVLPPFKAGNSKKCIVAVSYTFKSPKKEGLNFLLLHFILALERLLGQPLGLLPELLGHLLVSALGRSSHG